MAEALAVVKVGKTECGFLKLTPTSRTSAMAGAVSAVTLKARRPSATNRIRLLGRFASAASAPLATTMANANVSRPLNLSDIKSSPLVNTIEADHRLRLPPQHDRPRARKPAHPDEPAPFHVWMAPAWQEKIERAAQKSLAVMCPACSRSPDGLLALMGSANRGLITRAGSMSR